MDYLIAGPLYGQSQSCMPVLYALPAWFGIPEALVHYAAAIEELPTFMIYCDGQVAGFLSVKQHFPGTAELYVMGVRPEHHRHGIGRRLVAAAEAYLRERGTAYWQVKTLGPSHPDEGYARTRAFYRSVGFQPLEELPQVWDEHNPCLIMVKSI